MNLTEQELDQWIEQRDQEAEEEINSILQKISAETMSAIPLESVEMNEATPIEDDWSEPEEIIEVSLHESDISIAQNEADEAEKEIDVILERPEEPQKRSKEDQPLVLVFYALLLKHRSREPDITVEFDILILVLNLEDKVWDKFGGVSGNFSMATYYHNYDRFEDSYYHVEACDFCGESFHPTYACPYHPRYGNYHSSSYASPQLDFCMSRPSPRSPQQERRTIKDMEKDMISDWLSPSTKKYSFDGWSNSSYQQDTYSSMRNQPSRDIIRFLLDTEQDMNLTEQELDQWIEQRDQEAEEEINSILQKISAETMSAIPLESVEMNEATPIEDDWSEPEEIIEVSLHESDISIAQNEADEAEKEIDVILERPEEPQKRSKEDQPLVLVTPPTLPCLPVKFMKGVVIKERSQIFYTADTFVSDDHDLIDSYVLEVPDELLHLKEGMHDELPKAIDAPFIVDISKGEGIT
ncbi:hypothetical protein Sjap_021895 [Stephania japonica]|uniref:Uncharacterized protein n=1 Tax=Stephania japonica TaxID=461633 RepID=A0AAP0EV15_9MAGN